MMGCNSRSRPWPLLALGLILLSGCDMLDMYDEPRFEPLEASTLFDDGTSARPLVAGTVARGDLREDEGFYSGKTDGKYVTSLPVDLDEQLLLRGQERFNIYCSPCHGRVGDGNGMIVERGFRRPPSFVSTDRLLNSPVGHFYDVISNGFGAMPSYASRVAPRDRWAIVAYIRALQRSQNGSIEDVPPELRDNIAESEAVEQQEREKRGAAERLDTERQQRIERDIREHRRSPAEGEREHREIEREKKQNGSDDKQSARESAPGDQSAGQLVLAAKRRDSSAQGNALGWGGLTRFVALKGRYGFRGAAWSHPLGVRAFDFRRNPGRCPGLMSMTPAGSVVVVTKAAPDENRDSPSEALV